MEDGSLGLAKLEGIDQSVDAHNNPFETSALRDDLPKSKSKSKSKSKINAKQATSINDSEGDLQVETGPVEEAPGFGPFLLPATHRRRLRGQTQRLLLVSTARARPPSSSTSSDTEYPGCNIGPNLPRIGSSSLCTATNPEPPPGQTLAVQSDKPFTGLSAFGSSFLSKFEASQCDAKLLEEVTIVDTPGVLSGEKQRIDRYSFVQVCEWLSTSLDVILLLFDPAQARHQRRVQDGHLLASRTRR